MLKKRNSIPDTGKALYAEEDSESNNDGAKGSVRQRRTESLCRVVQGARYEPCPRETRTRSLAIAIACAEMSATRGVPHAAAPCNAQSRGGNGGGNSLLSLLIVALAFGSRQPDGVATNLQ